MGSPYGSSQNVGAGQGSGGHKFSQIPSANIQRSAFNRSCGLKTTFNSGFLVPIFADEALPGDTMVMRMNTFGRMATPLHPLMDNLYMDFFFFAVPIRLIWDNWQLMNGEQVDPGDSTDFLVPIISEPPAGAAEHSLSDYLGIPTKVDIDHSALWHRAYNLIYNEWFRDENMQDSVIVNRDDGPDSEADYAVLRRGKRHDYFTSCLPFPQKGPAINVPIGESAPIFGDVIGLGTPAVPTFDLDDVTAGTIIAKDNSSDEIAFSSAVSASGADADLEWNTPNLTLDGSAFADLSLATGATINELRESFQIQRIFERDARGGSRYTEIIRSHFGVVSPDQRLQRPEYLGGGTAVLNVNPVVSTVQGVSDLGELAAFVTSSSNGSGFTKSFVEHCVILGITMVRADLNYQQGLERQFSRRTRFDFFWPALAHLGEQAVLNKEIFADGSPADETVFGYQERYAEYRYKPSRVTGRFRSNSTTPLDAWHLSQDFAALPLLNETFIVENPPVQRVVAVLEAVQPEFLLDCWFDYRCARPMPTYSVPGMIDHF